jgi:hypothetical protein
MNSLCLFYLAIESNLSQSLSLTIKQAKLKQNIPS